MASQSPVVGGSSAEVAFLMPQVRLAQELGTEIAQGHVPRVRLWNSLVAQENHPQVPLRMVGEAIGDALEKVVNDIVTPTRNRFGDDEPAVRVRRDRNQIDQLLAALLQSNDLTSLRYRIDRLADEFVQSIKDSTEPPSSDDKPQIVAHRLSEFKSAVVLYRERFRSTAERGSPRSPAAIHEADIQIILTLFCEVAAAALIILQALNESWIKRIRDNVPVTYAIHSSNKAARNGDVSPAGIAPPQLP